MGANIPWNDVEANLRKTPTVFEDFTYDNTNDLIINTIDEIKKIIDKLDGECTNLNVYLSRLSNTYGNVNSYDDTIDRIKRDINNSMDDLDNRSKKLLNDFISTLFELAANNQDLFEDIQSMANSLMGGK